MATVVVPKDIVVEAFLTNNETKQLVGKIFIGITLMIFAAIVTFLFYWSYSKSSSMFIMIVGILMLAYSLQIIILTYKIREKLDNTMFNLYMGSAVLYGFIALFIIIFFLIKMARDSSSSSGYVPSGIQSYGNQ